MSSPVVDHRAEAMVMSREIRRVLGLPIASTSRFGAIDWELCSDIETCAKKAKAAKKERGDQNDSRTLKRGRLLTSDSDDEDEGNNVNTRQTRKKQKTAALEESDIMTMIASPTSSSLSYIAQEDFSPMEMPFIFTALDGFASLSIEPFEDFPTGGAGLSRTQRQDKEHQNFTIWEDPDEQEIYHSLPLTTSLPAYPDEDKENEPPEYDMTADDEFAGSEYDEYYYSVEQAQQQYREALSEIPN